MTTGTQQRILVTGGSGLLAPFLAEVGQRQVSIDLTSRRNGCLPCDLTDIDAVKGLIETTRPDVVIHCAAMTNVDECETNQEMADRTNRVASEILASVLPEDRQLVYISTDQVYPNVCGPHLEGSEDPVNVYGRSKLAGERAAMGHPNCVALRTSFFGPSRTPGRASLSDFVANSLKEGKQITLFSDVLFTPLHVGTLATTIFEIIEQRLSGVFNLATREGFSKAEFALKIAEHLGLQTASATIGTSANQPGRALRTTDLRLDPGRLVEALGRRMPTLQQEIEKL